MEFDHSRLSPKASAIFLLRGTALTPLRWFEHGNNNARATLEDLSDTQLFAPHNIADPPMALLLRGLLYLWHSLPEEAPMVAAGAPDPELNYLTGLVQRHMGKPNEAKATFQKIESHPVYETIAPKALEMMGLGVDPAIKRVADIIRMNEAWEPFAFIDLYEQAREEQLPGASVELVRELQQYEFMLLLRHCYLNACGVDIAKGASSTGAVKPMLCDDSSDNALARGAATSSRPSAPAWKRNAKAQRQAKKADMTYAEMEQQAQADGDNKGGKAGKGGKPGAKPDAMTGEKKPEPPKPKRELIRVMCPQCKKPLNYDPIAVGRRVQCTGCQFVFKLAGPGGAEAAA